MNHEPVWSEIVNILRDLVPPEASIAVSDERQYIDYRPGEYDIHIEPGRLIPHGSISESVIINKTHFQSFIDASLFGSPYFGKGYPFHLGNSIGVVTIIYPPDNTQQLPYLQNDPAIDKLSKHNFPIFTQQPAISFITGQADEVWRPVDIREIAYFESYNKKTWIYTKKGVYSTLQTIQSLEQQLPPSFIRIHRSFIVNIAMIEQIRRDISTPLLVILAAPFSKQLPVSQTYVKQLRSRLGF